MSCLLRGIQGLSRLSRCHEHNRLRGLTGLRILMHHHRRTSTRTWKPAMRLRGRMLRINVTRVWRIHLHLRSVRSHSLRNPHVGAIRRLLYHHRCCHSSLWVHKLRRSGVLSHVRGLWPSLVHVKLRHGLLERQLRMVGHRRRVRNVVVLESWGREHLRSRRRNLHSMGVIEMRRPRMMLLWMKMGPMWGARHWRHARGRLLERKGHLRLVRHLGVGGGTLLGENARYSNRRLEHLCVCLLFVTRWRVPGWQSLISRRDASVERIILIRLLGPLFLHTFNRVELIIERWSFSNRSRLFGTEEDRWTRGTRNGAASK